MLCLNMIVKNESARILRALDAVKPYIATFAVLDTGSTDDTIDVIKKWADQNGLKGIVAIGKFLDYSQARNDALHLARQWRSRGDVKFDYLLLQDADMELVVDDPKVFDDLAADCYEMMQTGGMVTYGNARLLSVYTSALYLGRTHEYLNIAADRAIQGARFIDHADGANRGQKYERDIVLLKKELDEKPNDARTLFYLGNTYRDQGMASEAEHCYRKRIEVGGWDEETFVAQCNVACCRKDQGDEAGFVFEMMKAHQMRPRRAEPLFDIAKHYREKGEHASAMTFVKDGIGVPRPNDRLFVNDYVYSHGFREEFSICGFYDESTREQAFHYTNGLSLDFDDRARGLARSNMVYYLRPLVEMAPSTKHTRIDFTPRDGFVAMNPSVCERPSGMLEVIVRTVNYRINEHGQYMIGDKGCQDAPIETENYLLEVSPNLSVHSPKQIMWERPPAKFPLVIGLEDMRLFWKNGERAFVACVREQSEHGNCEQWEGRLPSNGRQHVHAQDVQCVSTGFTNVEKNWMPINFMGKQRYMYRLNTVVDGSDYLMAFARSFYCKEISGSSPWLRFSGGYVSVVHEVAHNSAGCRVYMHRFVWTDDKLSSMRVSLPFVFQDVQIEFCAGIALHPQGGTFILSYGLKDEEAWFASVSVADVREMLRLSDAS